MINQTEKQYKVLIGDCVESMRQLKDKSVQCCVTSPPYFGLRDYGNDGQIGLEATPDQFVAALVQVFDEVHRVLVDDGTLWLNLGDSYAGNNSRASNNGRAGFGNPREKVVSRLCEGLKSKDLIGIPWRVAFALQSAGWYLRQDIIWHKPNPMPESVKDRCTKAHEYIFLLSKSPKYYYDNEAIKEPAVSAGQDRGGSKKYVAEYKKTGAQRLRTKAGLCSIGVTKDTKNKRSVWTVATKPYIGAHFATFPPDLIEPCILAGCPKGGTVLDPFGGSGTTAAIALKHGRKAIICELNSEYANLIPDRIDSIVPKANQLDMFQAKA